jgi:hypothetical protein
MSLLQRWLDEAASASSRGATIEQSSKLFSWSQFPEDYNEAVFSCSLHSISRSDKWIEDFVLLSVKATRAKGYKLVSGRKREEKMQSSAIECSMINLNFQAEQIFPRDTAEMSSTTSEVTKSSGRARPQSSPWNNPHTIWVKINL